MFGTFKTFCRLVTEVKDTRKNREDMIRAYGLADHGGSPEQAASRASELINMWNKYESLIGDDPETYGFPRNVRGLNPKDIYAWSRASKALGENELEALQNLEAMLSNLKKVEAQRAQFKQEQNDYEVVYKSNMVVVYIPRSVGASCKLGAGTKWCTAATKSQNMFKNYTQDQGVTLYYIHTKHEGKYAVALYPDQITMEVFDEEDNMLNVEDLDKTLRDHGVENGIKEIIKTIEVEDRLLELCQQYVGTIDKYKYNRDIYKEDQKTYEMIFNLSLELTMDKPDVYQRMRQQTGMPDQAILAWHGWSSYMNEIGEPDGEYDLINTEMVTFFLEKRLNPPGTMPETNKQFQTKFIETLIEYHDMLVRLPTTRYSPPGAWADGDDDQKRDYQKWNEMNGSLKQFLGENKQDQLRMYSKNHLDGQWEEFHEMVFQMIVDLPEIAIMSELPIVHFFRFVMKEKNGRWHELEQALTDHIEDLVTSGNMNDDKAPILRFAHLYNTIAAGTVGSAKVTRYIPTLADVIGRI